LLLFSLGRRSPDQNVKIEDQHLKKGIIQRKCILCLWKFEWNLLSVDSHSGINTMCD
jgi:hypothetical protein